MVSRRVDKDTEEEDAARTAGKTEQRRKFCQVWRSAVAGS